MKKEEVRQKMAEMEAEAKALEEELCEAIEQGNETNVDFTDAYGNVLKYNEGKPDWSTIPWSAMEDVVRVFEYGRNKYKDSFTYIAGIPVSSLFASAIRHLITWYYNRENLDPETGCNHLAHAVANALMILSYYKNKPEFDDRPKIK